MQNLKTILTTVTINVATCISRSRKMNKIKLINVNNHYFIS